MLLFGARRVEDLTERSDLTLALLDGTLAWRERLVDDLELGPSRHARLTSSYQIEFPRGLVGPHLGSRRTTHIKAIVPLTTRPKHPLLRFGIEGPGGRPAHLLRRADIAAIQAEYLRRLVLTSGADVADALPEALLEAICVFTPWTFGRVEVAPELAKLSRYLADGLGVEFDRPTLLHLRDTANAAGAVLVQALDEEPEPMSSSENILLALPYMDPRPRDVRTALAVVTAYRDAVVAAAGAKDHDLLGVLAEYGRRWEVCVEMEVPLWEPVTVRLREDVPLEKLNGQGVPLPLRSTAFVHRVPFGDARSYHLQVRVADPAVRIQSVELRDTHGRPSASWAEGVRETQELWSAYSSEPDRPFTAEVVIRVRPAWTVALTALGVEALVWLAVWGVASRHGTANELVAAFTLFAVPTTFAATLLVVRPQTALAGRLLAWSTGRTLIASLVLWTLITSKLAR